MIDQGGLKGQYHSPQSHPTSNALPGIIDSEKGKTYIRPFMAIGRCKHCLGPHHESRNDVCLYNKYCRVCLEYLPSLPNKGFHHSCHNLVEDMPRAQKPKGKTKIQPSAGVPENEAQAIYTPSEVFKRQRTLMLEAQEALKKQKTYRMSHQVGGERGAQARNTQIQQQQQPQLQQQPPRQQPQLPDLREQMQQQAYQQQQQLFETPRDQQALPDDDMDVNITIEQDVETEALLNYEDDEDM
jgi:hypothetical protein